MLEELFEIPPVFTASDNNLINGKNDYNHSLAANSTACQSNAGMSQFRFVTGKTHRLRLINAGACTTEKFTIDNHKMTVIANDFVPIEPYTTNVVTLGVGQRSDVLVKATGKPTDTVWMRADLDVNCALGVVNQPHALAAIYYPDANTNTRPNTTATSWMDTNCGNVRVYSCWGNKEQICFGRILE